MKEAIGIIETKGFVTAVGSLDAMLKSADVEVVGYKKKLGSELVTITIIGDVGAVNTAVDAGRRTGEQIGKVAATYVIPRISKDAVEVFGYSEKPKSIPKPVAPVAEEEGKEVEVKEVTKTRKPVRKATTVENDQ